MQTHCENESGWPLQGKEIMKKPAPEPEIESLEEFRWTLIRRLADLNDSWRACDQRACRRKRQCAAANAPCIARHRASRPKLSPAQEAEMMSGLYKRLAALAAQTSEENADG